MIPSIVFFAGLHVHLGAAYTRIMYAGNRVLRIVGLIKCVAGSVWLSNIAHFYLSAVVGRRTGIGIVRASYCNEVILLIYREIY